MGLPDVPDSIAPSVLAQMLRDLGLDPKLTIDVSITASEVTARCIALDSNGVLIRASGDSVVHTVAIPVAAAGAGQAAESP